MIARHESLEAMPFDMARTDSTFYGENRGQLCRILTINVFGYERCPILLDLQTNAGIASEPNGDTVRKRGSRGGAEHEHQRSTEIHSVRIIPTTLDPNRWIGVEELVAETLRQVAGFTGVDPLEAYMEFLRHGWLPFLMDVKWRIISTLRQGYSLLRSLSRDSFRTKVSHRSSQARLARRLRAHAIPWRNRLPNGFRIDVLVLVAKKIAGIPDVAPWNLRIALPDRWVECERVLRRFGDALQPIGDEITRIDIAARPFGLACLSVTARA
jgi:hypothetical protein